jgi:glycosyltransferase involved in cell wall biosynthesis
MAGGGDLTFVISADYARRTGGWIYDQRLLNGLRARGWRINEAMLPAGFPVPSPEARAHAAAAFRAMPDGVLVLADQLCLGVLPEVAGAEGRRLRLVMIVHHPLALEGYAGAHEGAGFQRCEKEALRHVAAVIVTSAGTARTLTVDYAVSPDRIIIAVPGVERRPLARGSGGGVLNLLSVGALVPRKNHVLLLRALAGLRHLPWRLSLVGNVTRAPSYIDKLHGIIGVCGLAARVSLRGELPDDRLARLWSSADLYVSASRHEGYGMALAEAFAHGVPVVSTQAGAAALWVGRRGAKLVRDGSLAPLRAALGEVLGSPSVRLALQQGARARRPGLPRWEATAETVDRRLRQLVEGRS